MFARMLFSTFAAATLLTAAPALASGGDTSERPCTCCSDGSFHSDHALREAPGRRDAPQPKDSDDPYIRNQSFGG